MSIVCHRMVYSVQSRVIVITASVQVIDGLSLEQHDSSYLCAFVHVVGGGVGFALPLMFL